MKRIIRKVLDKAGYELIRKREASVANRSTMTGALGWLHDNGIRISTVLDVGASNGSWSQSCMSFFPEAKYVLFEPQPVHSDALDAFAKSCKQTVVLVKKAVGGAEGSTLFDARDPFGGALASKKADKVIEVKLTTIDSCLSELKTDGPYLLKLDTHGYEKCILEGASGALDKCEALVIEAYNYRIADQAFLFWELCAFLYERGFSTADLVDILYRPYDNSLWQMDLIFVRSTWKGFSCKSYSK